MIGLVALYIDNADRAAQHARTVGAVVVDLPVAQDFRRPERSN
jgi:hypothetical protein